MRRMLLFFRSGRGLSTFAAIALAWMVLVILEGAVVRATGSGAGCGNHWPLCNGDFVPRHPRVATIIEFTHRSMTGLCTGLVAAVIGWTAYARPRGERVRTAAYWSGFLLLTEAFLGAVLVKGGYVEHNASNARVLVQCIHFTNTMLLLGALSLAWWWQQPRDAAPIQSFRLKNIAWLGIAATILTGATGSVAALADTLFPSVDLRSAFLADLSSSSPLLVRMRWMHPAASLAAFALIGSLALRVKGSQARTLWALLASQIVLGVADVFTLAPITLQVLHLLGADLLWIALVCTAAGVVLPLGARRFQSATRRSTNAALTVKSA